MSKLEQPGLSQINSHFKIILYKYVFSRLILNFLNAKALENPRLIPFFLFVERCLGVKQTSIESCKQAFAANQTSPMQI
jgi:hypothetical protein